MRSFHMRKIYMENASDDHKDFPPWNCQYPTVTRFKDRDRKVRMKALRISSSAFISRSDVREYIFGHKGSRCYICGADADQIDHKKPVYEYACMESEEIKDFSTLNSYENLFPICRHCNASR